MEGRISSEDRSCVDNFFGGLVLILLEVLLEHSSEVRDFGIVGFLVFPSVSRKQDIRIDTRASSGDCEVEDRHVLEFALFQFSAVNRIDDLSRHLQAHSRSLAVFTTRPTGVDDPAVSAVFFHLLSKHVSVSGRVQWQEGFTEASGESSLGFSDTDFRACNLRGVAGDKVVHGLRIGEFGNGREDTVGIAGEENDVGGMFASRGEFRVGDVLKRVACTGVFSDGNVIVVDDALLQVGEFHVLKKCTESDRIEDLGFLFLRKIDCFRVATTFNVEHTVIAPAMFIVTEELSIRVSGQGSFTCAGQTEEQRDVAVLAFSGGRVQ